MIQPSFSQITRPHLIPDLPNASTTTVHVATDHEHSLIKTEDHDHIESDQIEFGNSIKLPEQTRSDSKEQIRKFYKQKTQNQQMAAPQLALHDMYATFQRLDNADGEGAFQYK